MGNAMPSAEEWVAAEPMLQAAWCLTAVDKGCSHMGDLSSRPVRLGQVAKPINHKSDWNEIPSKDLSDSLILSPRVSFKLEQLAAPRPATYQVLFDLSDEVPGDGLKGLIAPPQWAPPSPAAARVTPRLPKELPKELPLELPANGAESQRLLGAQSLRGNAPQFQLQVLDAKTEVHAHAKKCFQQFLRNEEELCGDWAVFYHSYTHAALLYEVHAALAAVLYKFNSQTAPLPRLKAFKFSEFPDADSLQVAFDQKWADNAQDHHDDFREVGLSVMCSLVSTGPEVSTPVVFIGGYMHSDDEVPFRSQLEDLLCGLLGSTSKATLKEVNSFIDDVVRVGEEHSLDVSKWVEDGRESLFQAGHMMQIFIRRDKVDELAYAAAPFGGLDSERQPLSAWYEGDTDTSWGQARILARPDVFMAGDYVKSFVANADPMFHDRRPMFQKQLSRMVEEFLLGRVSSAVAKKALGQGWTPLKKAAPKQKKGPRQLGKWMRASVKNALGGPTLGEAMAVKSNR